MYTTQLFWMILVSTPPCFDHISLIRTWNGAPFFLLVSLLFKEHFIKSSEFSSIGWTGWHLVQPVSRASLCEALFFGLLEPKSYMFRVHKLQLDHGQYCGSILGLGLSYMQPTMNPYGYLVVKQAKNLRYSACMENEEKS